MDQREYGKYGEELAAKYLKRHRFTLLERNYTCLYGEADLIVKKGNLFCFVEVKARSSEHFGLPREAVTPYKQHRYRKIAMQYLKAKGLLNPKTAIRFDVIEVLDGEITHIENAF